MPGAKIHIEEPCHVAWNGMQPHDKGKFCGQCQTPVIDFTHYSLEEIRQYFKANSQQPVCGRYHARHTSEATPWLDKVNGVENRIRRSGFKKVSIIAVAALLLFSQCARRRVMGAKFFINDDKKPASIAKSDV